MARRRKNLFSKKGGGKRLRVLVLRTLTAFVVLVLLLLLAWNRLLTYMQGDSFRRYLGERLSEASGAQVVLAENLHIDGSRLSQPQVDIEHSAGNSGRIERLSMEINRAALLRRILHINKVTMEEGTVTLTHAAAAALGGSAAVKTAKKDTPSQAGTTESAATTQKQSAAAAAPAEKPFFSLQDFIVDELECKNTDFSLSGSEPNGTYALQGTTLTAKPAAGREGHWHINLDNGHFSTPFNFLRSCSLKHAALLYNGKSLSMSECRFMLTPGELRVQSRYDFAPARWTADLSVNKANVHRLLKEDWKKRLSGELFGKLKLAGNAGGITKGNGNLALQQGVLEGLPFLSELSIDNTYPYRSIELEKAVCRITYPYNSPSFGVKDAWLFDEISVVSKGRTLLIRGHVLIGPAGELGGTLTFGIPKQNLAALSPFSSLVSQIFNGKGDAAYAWVNMNLSGTVDEPQEDLSVRLTTLVSEMIPQTAAQGMDAAAALFSGLLQQAAGAVGAPAAQPKKEQAEPSGNTPTPTDVLDKAAESAGSVIQSGMNLFF